MSIDDATLAEWEKRKRRSIAFIFDSSGTDLPDFLGIPTEDYEFLWTTLSTIIAEIRRLQEQLGQMLDRPGIKRAQEYEAEGRG